MVEEVEKEKKRKGLRLVSRKPTRKMLGKWKKLDDSDKYEKQYQSKDVEPLRQVLCVTLETAIDVDPSLDGVPLPAFFRHSIDYVETHDELERKVNEGGHLSFVEGHEAAGLIKRFLRQLPEPLLPSDFETLVKDCSCDWREVCQCPIRAKKSENKMGIHALGLLFQTVLEMSRQLVCYLIVNASGRLSNGSQRNGFLFDDMTIVP
ncbi:unnamed protein product [Nippostrongylus brasiliensis]|uniref:Rho-GAP domain-containing protein n=1 Tax=Nippostrongylus brasiliensis TaxID=27835 RepID=A0A0N4Y7D5_NIPBR|nr:unnamed protein product [Nippostrongylus brasiliensis]